MDNCINGWASICTQPDLKHRLPFRFLANWISKANGISRNHLSVDDDPTLDLKIKTYDSLCKIYERLGMDDWQSFDNQFITELFDTMLPLFMVTDNPTYQPFTLRIQQIMLSTLKAIKASPLVKDEVKTAWTGCVNGLLLIMNKQPLPGTDIQKFQQQLNQICKAQQAEMDELQNTLDNLNTADTEEQANTHQNTTTSSGNSTLSLLEMLASNELPLEALFNQERRIIFSRETENEHKRKLNNEDEEDIIQLANSDDEEEQSNEKKCKAEDNSFNPF